MVSAGRVFGSSSVMPNDPAIPPSPVGASTDVKLEFQWTASRTCDGNAVSDVSLIAAGDIEGSNGTWRYLDIDFHGPGLQGFAEIPPFGHVITQTDATIDGTNDAGTLALHFAGQGFAALTSAVRLVDCKSGEALAMTLQDQDEVCRVTDRLFWAESMGPEDGAPTLQVWSSLPATQKGVDVHEAHVYRCPGPGGALWNPSVAVHPP